MLVLARKQGEVVVIGLPDGRRVRVQVANWNSHGVRLAIDAPGDVAVDREEIAAAKAAEAAAMAGTNTLAMRFAGSQNRKVVRR